MKVTPGDHGDDIIYARDIKVKMLQNFSDANLDTTHARVLLL